MNSLEALRQALVHLQLDAREDTQNARRLLERALFVMSDAVAACPCGIHYDAPVWKCLAFVGRHVAFDGSFTELRRCGACRATLAKASDREGA